MFLNGARCLGLGLDRVGRLPPRFPIHHDEGVPIAVYVWYEKVDQVAVVHLVWIFCRLQIATMRFSSRL